MPNRLITKAEFEAMYPAPGSRLPDPAVESWAPRRGLAVPDTTLEAERQWCLLTRSVLRQYQHRHHTGMLAAVPGPSRLWDAYDHLAAQLTALLEAWPQEDTDG